MSSFTPIQAQHQSFLIPHPSPSQLSPSKDKQDKYADDKGFTAERLAKQLVLGLTKNHPPSKPQTPSYKPRPGHHRYNQHCIYARQMNQQPQPYLPSSPLRLVPSASLARPSASPSSLAQIKKDLLFIQHTIACICHLLLNPGSIPENLTTVDDAKAIRCLSDPQTYSQLSTIITLVEGSPTTPLWDMESASSQADEFLKVLSNAETLLIKQLTHLDSSTPPPSPIGEIALKHLPQKTTSYLSII